MIGKVSLLTEADSALLTSKRFVKRVSAPMPRQLVLYAKAFTTNVADMILLARVRCQVADHLLLPSEEFFAVATLKWVFVRVDFAVYVERSLRLEGFAT